MTRAAHALPAVLLAVLLGGCASPRAALLRPPPLSPEMQSEPDRFVVVTVSNAPRPLARRPGSTPRGYDVASPYGVTAAAGAAVRGLEHDYGLREVSAWPITTLSVHCIVFRVPTATTPATMIDRLSKDARVESAQMLNQFATQDVPAPAAAGAREAYSLQASLRALNVVEAHRWSLGTGVRVAVVDTGMDFEHPALKERVVSHSNFVDNDDARFKLDRHGTQVGGLIAAVAHNDLGIVGIAPESKLLSFKACWQLAGDAARAVCNSFTLAQALEAAILAHADVINLSLSGPSDPLLTRLVRRGEQTGILFVGAVAPQGASGEFPAGIDGVLAVASAEDASSSGGRYLLAPGREVLTLVPGGHLDFASGSSLAAAEVSGTLALLLAEQHGITAARARSILTTTSAQVIGPSGAALTSINACAALVAIMQRDSCVVEPDSTAGLRRNGPAAR